jgi:hypothetical protein
VTAPNTPNAVPRSRPWVGGREQRQRRGEHDRAADALDPARQRQERRIARDAAQQRAEREDDDAGGEHDPPPDAVGDHARREQESGERQRVRVDHPLQIGQAGAERSLDVGERDDNDRDVEQEHEDAERHGCERPPLAGHWEPPGEGRERTRSNVAPDGYIVK